MAERHVHMPLHLNFKKLNDKKNVVCVMKLLIN